MRILICVSGMPYSRSTVHFGALLGQLEPSEVTLLIVVDEETGDDVAAGMLDRAARLLEVPIVAQHVCHGSPLSEILAALNGDEYDMLVIGSRIAVSIPDMWMRPLSQRLAEKAPTSVLVVKEDRSALNRLLICTGGTNTSRTVVRFGARLAARAQATVNLMHVAKSIPAMYTGLHGMEETLSELLQTDTPLARHLRWAAAQLDASGVPGQISLRHGLAVSEIIRESTEGNYDLVIIGAPDEGSRLRFLLSPAIAMQLVNRVPCSILVARSWHVLAGELEHEL